MADTKISNLAAVSSLGDTDEAVLEISGASKKITGANIKASMFDATVPSTQAIGDSAAAGSAAVAARRDHKHAMPAFATNAIVLDSSAAAGSASTLVRSDATIAAFDATSPTTQAIGDAAAVGTAAFAARRDHKHAMPAFATPAIVLGSAAAAGSAATLVRSDGTIAAFDTTVPTTQAFGDAAAVGTAAFAARRDHKHAMPADPTGGYPWTAVRKTADQDVASSTTVANDTHLFFTATAGVSYEVLLLILYLSAVGAGTPDIKYDIGEDGTARGAGFNALLTAADAVFLGLIGTGQVVGSAGTSATQRTILIHAGHTGAGGTFRFRWAQNTSGSNATTVKAGSVILYRPFT